MKYLIASIALFTFTVPLLNAAPGCMSITNYAEPTRLPADLAYAWTRDTHQYDYKLLHTIECSHNCKPHDISDKGRCRWCRHFGPLNRGTTTSNGQSLIDTLQRWYRNKY